MQKTLVLLLMLGAVPADAQLSFRSVLVDGDKRVHRANAGSVELDYAEQFELQARSPESANPDRALPIPCLVRRIELTASSGDKLFTKKIDFDPADPNAIQIVRYTTSVEALVKGENWDVTAFNVEKIAVNARMTYRTPPAPTDQVTGCTALQGDLSRTEQVDVFPVPVRHYGFYVLFDFKPVASGAAAFLDAIGGGVLNSLSYASVDYPYVVGKGQLSNAMVSAPVAGFDTRKWYGHLQLEAVLIRGVKAEDVIGRGVALGIYRPDQGASLLKLGAIERDETEGTATKKRTRAFAGVSLPTLSAWLAGKKR